MAFAKGGGSGGGSTTTSAPFTISSTSATANVAAGQTITFRFSVRSSKAATGVNAYVKVMHEGSPDIRLDIRNLTFAAGETKSLSASYVARSTDRVGTKYWAVDVFQNSLLQARAYTVRGGTTMAFNQTSGVGIFEPFGSEYDNPCDAEAMIAFYPCSMGGSITANVNATTVGYYFADSYRVTPLLNNVEEIRRFNGSSVVNSDISSLANIASANTIDNQFGDERTLAIISNANIASDSAADYCADLNNYGFSDWHLPSKTELALLYCRSNIQKGTVYPQEMPGCATATNYGYGLGFPGVDWAGRPQGVPFTTQIYLSSTEADANNVWAINFATGQEITISKSTAAAVRCIRKQYGLK